MLLLRQKVIQKYEELRDNPCQPETGEASTEQILGECNLCRRCVRVCKDTVGAEAITYVPQDENGNPAKVVWDPDKCIACGSCAYICPTRAIGLKDEDGRRIIETPDITMEFEMKTCTKCGACYAPDKQVKYMAQSSGLPLEKFDLCPDCRE